MKYYITFLAILCSTHNVNTVSSDDFAQNAQTEFVDIHTKRKKKKNLKKALLPCVYIGAAFVMILMGKKGWVYYTKNNQIPTPPPTGHPGQSLHAAPNHSPPIIPSSDTGQYSTTPPASREGPIAQPDPSTLPLGPEQEHKKEIEPLTVPSSNSSTTPPASRESPIAPPDTSKLQPDSAKEHKVTPDLTQLAIERKKRQEEQRKKQEPKENPIPASSNTQPSNQSSFSMRALWQTIASSGSPISKAQPDSPDNSDADDEDDEEKSASLQLTDDAINLGKIVQKAREQRNYPSDSIESLIKLWHKNNDISYLRRILKKDPSYLMIAVAGEDCDLIKGFLKAGAQAELLDEAWQQEMKQLLLQDTVKLCTAVRNHKKEDDTSFIEALIKSKADVNCKLKGKTPLDIAVMEAHYTCIQPLLEAKAQMTTRRHPIVWWIDNFTEQTRKDTIARDTNIFIHSFPGQLNNTTILGEGNTFLHHAASKNASAILLALLDYKADPSLVNYFGQTPLELAQFLQSKGDNNGVCISILVDAMKQPNKYN